MTRLDPVEPPDKEKRSVQDATVLGVGWQAPATVSLTDKEIMNCTKTKKT